jgi:aminomethyltransferase
MKRSPFFDRIAEQQPSLVAVQGWEVANGFSSAAQEHQAVRERAGLMDWSTTGEFEVQGPDALELVQRLIVNDASRMPIHRVLYTTMLSEDGSIQSDITVYRLGENHYMLMTAWGSNAANARPEYELLLEQAQGLDACVFDASPGTGLLALQGPRSRALLSALIDGDLDGLPYMWATPGRVAGTRALISRTGYTGELGYEVLVPAEHADEVWAAVMEAGDPYGLALCGMVAAFSLRMEKGYIMRFDFAGGRTPYEVGLGWTVKLDKGDFRGREALIRRTEAVFRETLVSLQVQDGHVPASGETIRHGERPVGNVTSAAFGYTLGKPLALGYVPLALDQAGTEVTIQDGGGYTHPALVGPRSPYDPGGARLRM